MSPFQIAFTRRALTDLTRIRDGIASDSVQGATTVLVSIFNAIDKLVDTPHRAVVADQPTGQQDPVRSVAVGSYMVYFRAIDRTHTVRVVRVRHGARRPLRRY